eukprot:4549414-Karenia_brevis.AAC.1
MGAVLCEGADHKGSDVRLVSGEMMRARPWPRQGASPEWWEWQVAIAYRWKHVEHINVLEGRAAHLMMLWRCRHSRIIGSKFVHLLNSQVNIGVLTKKRSS